MIRVLVVNTVAFTSNGISSIILNTSLWMNRAGIELDFAASGNSDAYYVEKFKQMGTSLYTFNKANPVKYIASLFHLMRNRKYDIVHVHGNSAMMTPVLIAALLAGIPVRIVHSHNTQTNHPIMHRLLYPLFSSLYTQAVACGHKAGEWLFHKKPFVVLNNGIDMTKYKFCAAKRARMREEYRCADDTVYIHVGRFNANKNHVFLINVFDDLLRIKPNSKLILVGTGDLYNIIVRCIKEKKLMQHIICVGETDRVAELLMMADCFVLPSVCEGLPVVLIEAQASGLPCYVSDHVPIESDKTNSLKFLEINTVQDIHTWVQNLSQVSAETDAKRMVKSQTNIELLQRAGYDIRQVAKRLRDLYISSVLKENR